jgi:ribonuclease HII
MKGNLEFIQNYEAPYIIGIDEVGTGAWAGPFVVAACACKRGWKNALVKDSKLFKDMREGTAHEQRLEVANKILAPPEIEDSWIYTVSHEELDAPNKMSKALNRAIGWLIHAATKQYPESLVVVDGSPRKELHRNLYNARSSLVYMPKADRLVPVVAAASIIAKAHRDSHMLKMAEEYPGYDFENNKGYGTQRHRSGVEKAGLCAIHRRGCRIFTGTSRNQGEAGKMGHGIPSGKERETRRPEKSRGGVCRQAESQAAKAS